MTYIEKPPVKGHVIIPMNWIDQDAPWSVVDEERASLCDHRGTFRTITETCECGHELLKTRQHAEYTGDDE